MIFKRILITISTVLTLGLAVTLCARPMPKDKTFVNSIGMRLVCIEAGSFEMGNKTGGDWDERPAHKVKVSRPFYMGETEVTNAQYEKFDVKHKKLRGKLGFSRDDNEAAVFVSWHEAAAFCEWLSKKEGRPYRLPTEAEWEYACRAGTTTPFHTGESLPEAFQKNPRLSSFPSERAGKDEVVPLTVAKTLANTWGLRDMHGNVEEWCHDWYGPYSEGDQVDPVGRAEGDFRITRGGSHSTTAEFLRSANRSGTLPKDKSWLIGFRVILGEMPETAALPAPPAELHRLNVKQPVPDNLSKGPDPGKPYFKGPRQYVKIPGGSNGPLFSRHNHDPAIVECPNGDLLAIWYTCRREVGRELGIAASRLRYGAEEWEPATPFWDAPDRNDHAPAMWYNGKGKIYHFNGLSAAATWGNLATIMRTSTDSGATWSKARLIVPEHGIRHMPVESVFRTREGFLVLPCDVALSAIGGTTIHLSRDEGETWEDLGLGQPGPDFRQGNIGAWIAGIHAGVVQLKGGHLLAFGRGNNIEGRMPQSFSTDMGRSWRYSASPFPPIGGGRRLVIMRLKEGPILFCSFTKEMMIKDVSGKRRLVSGLFAALSFDEGRNWPVRKLISDFLPARRVDGGGHTGWFNLGPSSAEPRGYLSACQTPDGVIQLISSKQHYAFNLAWLKEPMPAVPPPPKAMKLPAKYRLGSIFVPKELPSRTKPWRYNGSRGAENDQVSFLKGIGMKIDTGPGQRCRWVDDSADGFAAAQASKGFTAEIRMQVLKSTSGSRGVDFETCVRTESGGFQRYFITVTKTSVHWYGDIRECIAKELNNHAAMHTYRLSVRKDGIVQIYRDARLLAMRGPRKDPDRMAKAKGSYLQWGEGAGRSETDALVQHVAYDLGGPYRPSGRSK